MFRFAVAVVCAKLVAAARVTVDEEELSVDNVQTHCPDMCEWEWPTDCYRAAPGKCTGDQIYNWADNQAYYGESGGFASYGDDVSAGISSLREAATRCNAHGDCTGFYTRPDNGYGHRWSHWRTGVIDVNSNEHGHCCYRKYFSDSGGWIDSNGHRTWPSLSELSAAATAAEQESVVEEGAEHDEELDNEEVAEHDEEMDAATQGLRRRRSSTRRRRTQSELSNLSGCSYQQNTDYWGGQYDLVDNYSIGDCAARCRRDGSRCRVAVWYDDICYLKDGGRGDREYSDGRVALYC